MSVTVEQTPLPVGLPFTDREEVGDTQTDLRHWRLRVDNGRHMWKYVEGHDRPQRFNEKYWLGLPLEAPDSTASPMNRPAQSLKNGLGFLKQLQTEGGNWGCNCDGPMFVTSGMVIAMYILGFSIERHMVVEMCRYLINTANEDGGWGTYLDSPSNVFGTTLNYIALRMLGLPKEHRVCAKALAALSALGGPLGLPTWGKFWLCLLGLYEWEGMMPLPPELLLPPSFFPINPANWWMPIRNIYTSMAYLYGHRFKMREDALISELREELYDMPYCEIDWRSTRSRISERDLLRPRTAWQSATAFALRLIEQCTSPFLRRRALTEALFHIEAEVHNTRYLCLTPVSWATNIIALWHAHGPDSHWVCNMRDRFIDPMWMCREGMTASGTDGTAVWDTSFSVQAICGYWGELQTEDIRVLTKALEFLDNSQIRQNPLGLEHVYRHPTKGAWPFSTHDQGYAVSDTTAEALTAVLQIQKIDSIPIRISVDRLYQAVDALLGLESRGGGFAAYEQVRGPAFLELFNITDMYDSCMVESLYPECTGSVMIALTEFAAQYPGYRAADIQQCLARSVSYLLSSQYPDGGWIGSWGVCFTYATMFSLKGLACAGLFEKNCIAVKKACAFLLRHQNTDGGWGESLYSSRVRQYVSEPKGSQIPNTAYCVIGLIAAQCSNDVAIKEGVRFIMQAQLPMGDWAAGTLEGIYTPPCGYRYPLYKFHFTLAALSQYVGRYGNNRIVD